MPARYDTRVAPKFYWDTREVDHLFWDTRRGFDRASVPTIDSFTASPSTLASGDWTSQTSVTLAWTTTGAVSLELYVTTEDGTRTNINVTGAGVASGNITSAAPRQDAVYALTARNTEGTVVAHATYHYNVAAALMEHLTFSVLSGGPDHHYIIRPAMNFAGHTIVAGFITVSSHRIDLATKVPGTNNFRHISGGTSPFWNNWAITQDVQNNITFIRNGTPRRYTMTMSITTRDGTTEQRHVDVNVPA